jgi:hypothetical protein
MPADLMGRRDTLHLGAVVRAVEHSRLGVTLTIVEYHAGSGMVESAQRTDTLVLAQTDLSPLSYRSRGRYFDVAL